MSEKEEAPWVDTVAALIDDGVVRLVSDGAVASWVMHGQVW